MESLTIAYATARRDPAFQWFFDSLHPQIGDLDVRVIVVDMLAADRDLAGVDTHGIPVRHVPCKPNIWQGAHRLTPRDWWALSTYRNTAVCLCETTWIAMLDDRCVLMPSYIGAIRRAMEGRYAVCGRYQKRYNMEVVNGAIAVEGQLSGEDPRLGAKRTQNKPGRHAPAAVPGNWFFGACNAQPLEWALEINGWDESCDPLGLEDCVYGAMLERRGRPIRYDPQMFMVEDRSSFAVEPPLAIRADKGKSPNDKSHAILKRTAGSLRATHDIDLRAIRSSVLAGEPFPIPTGPTTDWYDGQPLSEFT